MDMSGECVQAKGSASSVAARGSSASDVIVADVTGRRRVFITSYLVFCLSQAMRRASLNAN